MKHTSDHTDFIDALAEVIGGTEAHAKAERTANAFTEPANLAKASVEEIANQANITITDARRIISAIALTQHFYTVREAPPTITSPEELLNEFVPLLTNKVQENFAICTMNTRNKPIKTYILYKGSQDASTVRVGEIFKDAISQNASAIAIAHNHPSGDTSPSQEDITLTKAVIEAGNILDIRVLDHLIIGNYGTYRSIKRERPELWKA